MFKLDMDAIRKTAFSGRHILSPPKEEANSQNDLANNGSLAKLATLAISHGEKASEMSLLTARLLVAAMKVCDQHGDGEEARNEMRQQCLELSPLLQADLLEHFQGKRPFHLH